MSVIREMQTKTTVREHFTPIKMAKVKRPDLGSEEMAEVVAAQHSHLATTSTHVQLEQLDSRTET